MSLICQLTSEDVKHQLIIRISELRSCDKVIVRTVSVDVQHLKKKKEEEEDKKKKKKTQAGQKT